MSVEISGCPSLYLWTEFFMLSSSSSSNLTTILKQLSPLETEPNVCAKFIHPLLENIGFSSTDWYKEFPTGTGSQKVDYAIKKGGVFETPEILLEVKGRGTEKGRTINLSNDTKDYKETTEQIKRYLLSPKCKTVKWGVITNSKHLQIFRKYGKVIHPFTANLDIDEDNIQVVAQKIQTIINSPKKALTVAVYNNKGGVGKTTTVLNLASLLTLYNRKVLVIDLDPRQRDLSKGIDMTSHGSFSSNCNLSDVLFNTPKIPLKNAISCYQTLFKNQTGKVTKKGFDVILGDPDLNVLGNKGVDLIQLSSGFTILDELLNTVRQDYDYVIIDTCPNWNLFSQMAVYTSDVVLIPARHNNIYSLENAAIAISEFIPEMQRERQKNKGLYDHGPIALPVFINGAKPNDLAKKHIQETIHNIATNTKVLPCFFAESFTP